MNNMQEYILSRISHDDYRTTTGYIDAYMGTIEKGVIDAMVLEDANIDTKAVIKKSEEVFETTHMAGHPIFSHEDRDRKLEKRGHKYNRSKMKKEAQEIIEEAELEN